MKKHGAVMKAMVQTTLTMRLATKNIPAQVFGLFENIPLIKKVKD